MGADWGTFRSNVKAIILNQTPNSPEDFGEKLAKEYLKAVKGKAKCVPGMAMHQSSPGESDFISSYRKWFKDLWEKGEPTITTPDDDEPLVNERQRMLDFLSTSEGAQTRITLNGKDQDPAYEKLEEEIGEGIKYEPTEELDKYLEEYKNDPTENLYRFRWFEFHRLDGTETFDQLARIFSVRLLMQFKNLKRDERLYFWAWLEDFKSGGQRDYNEYNEILEKIVYMSPWQIDYRNRARYAAVNTVTAKTGARVGAHAFHQLIYDYVHTQIFISHPYDSYLTYTKTKRNGKKVIEERTEIEAKSISIKREAVYDIDYISIWPFDKQLPENYEDMEPAEKLKVRYPFELNRLKIQEPFEDNSKMPPVLTRRVIDEFTYPKKIDDEDSKYYRYGGTKDDLLKAAYTENELRKKWYGCPLTEGDGQNEIVNADMSNSGTVFKQIRNTLIIELAAEEAMLAEGGSKDDPYRELAKATLKYWKDASIKPFAKMTATPPCVVYQPLGGLYIGVSYGNQKKLADNLRRALNSGKDSNTREGAATLVSNALAYSYFTHLSQMKFIYMGGIPIPLVPYIPMIGFDATVI